NNDIIINEILFHPISPGVEYVELYNRSDKVVDLSKIMIGTIKKSFPNPADTVVKEISKTGKIILPKSYILLSTDGEIVKCQYYSDSDDFLDIESLPSLPNDEGHVVICDKSRNIIDEVFYSEKMHYDLLIETQGVSLERISSENPSYDKNNWHSAAYNVNYGTPGYKNSMSDDMIEVNNDNEVNIVPEVFSPDNDGFDDICNIYYDFDENAYTLNIKIFNSKGILVRNLLNNSLINNKGFISWNGCDDNNHLLDPGIYVVQAEIFDLKGFVKRIRKVTVLAIKKSP
ncbi:MAG: lamin tail domain-containing protein, partial [Bacteroidales bacterium]|nr:lamin tail domain-containing protein [Bacteroidales bacterium]